VGTNTKLEITINKYINKQISFIKRNLKSSRKEAKIFEEFFCLQVHWKAKNIFFSNAKSHFFCSAVSSYRWCWFQSLRFY